jgi:cyclopropane-fatty-acyl-phospholipid synthase
MWEFYLAYCEAGFASRYLGVSQIRLARTGDGPAAR